MAQTITEDRLDPTSRDFSDLAWKFNNLNSTAKMLLVGTNSQSVPFIPISELADENIIISSGKMSSLPLSKPLQNNNISVDVLKSSSPNIQNTYLKPVSFEKTPEKYKVEEKYKVQEEYKPFVLDEQTQTIEEKRPEPINSAYTNSVVIPEIETEDQEELISNSYTPINTWSYNRRPYLEEEEYTPTETQTEKKPSFMGPFLRTTGIVSALALICAGAFYFWNDNHKKPQEDSVLDELTQTQTPSDINTSPEINTNTNTTENTYSDKALENNTYSPSGKTFVDEAPAKKQTEYYQPKISAKPIQKKAKVYKSPSAYTQAVKTSSPQNTLSDASKVKSGYPYSSANLPDYSPSASIYSSAPIEPHKPQPLFDPSTIYDSTARDAINPETYTPEKFPIEISYTVQSPQFEDNFTVPNSINNNTSQNTQEINNTIDDENDLTEEERQINIDEKPLNTSTNSAIPVYGKPISELNITPKNNSPYSSVPVYTKPVKNITEQQEEPVLRKPIQSSSTQNTNDETFASPYKAGSNLTTTMIETDTQANKPVERKSSFFRRKKYSQEYKKVSAVNNANSALSTYQDRLRQVQKKAETNNLSEQERAKLSNEIEVLKRNIIQTQKELDETNQSINQLENSASKVYLTPNFEENDEDNASLNISYL